MWVDPHGRLTGVSPGNRREDTGKPRYVPWVAGAWPALGIGILGQNGTVNGAGTQPAIQGDSRGVGRDAHETSDHWRIASGIVGRGVRGIGAGDPSEEGFQEPVRVAVRVEFATEYKVAAFRTWILRPLSDGDLVEGAVGGGTHRPVGTGQGDSDSRRPVIVMRPQPSLVLDGDRDHIAQCGTNRQCGQGGTGAVSCLRSAAFSRIYAEENHRWTQMDTDALH